MRTGGTSRAMCVSSHLQVPAQLPLTGQQAKLRAQGGLEVQHQVICQPQGDRPHVAMVDAEPGGVVRRACHHAACNEQVGSMEVRSLFVAWKNWHTDAQGAQD